MSDCVEGQIVKSIAGRDKNTFMVVVGFLEDGQVLLCDGNIRKISHPKKKKLKHLAATKTINIEIQEKLRAGKKIQNAEIRKILKPWQLKTSAETIKEV
jgi:ribosomal protein L14E/L6E/L27E